MSQPALLEYVTTNDIYIYIYIQATITWYPYLFLKNLPEEYLCERNDESVELKNMEMLT